MDRLHANLLGMNLDTFLRIIVNLLDTSFIRQSLKQADLHCWRNPLNDEILTSFIPVSNLTLASKSFEKLVT